MKKIAKKLQTVSLLQIHKRNPYIIETACASTTTLYFIFHANY